MAFGSRRLPIFMVLFLAAALGHGESAPPPLDSIEGLVNTEITTVTGASKYQQEITDAPASVSVITQDDIQKAGYRTLAELLNSLPEFYTTYDRTYDYLGVQGFSPSGDYNTRILVLVDGHRLNDEVFQQAPISDIPLDLGLLDRVEVIRGPGSSVYGSNAFMAVIDLITRSGRGDSRPELAASVGTYWDRAGRATAGGRTDQGWSWLVSASAQELPGAANLRFPEYAGDDLGVAHDLDHERSSNFLAKLAWGHWSLLALQGTRTKQPPTAPFNTIFNDPAILNQDRHALVGLVYSRPDEFADLSARLAYNRYDYLGDWPLAETSGRVLNRDTALGEAVGSDVWVAKTLAAHLLTLGMEDRWAFRQDQRNFDVEPDHRSILDDRRRTLIAGYYLQDEWHPLSRLIVTAGARLDHYQTFGSTLNPRAAVIWKPQPTTFLRLSYGKAFRAPSVYEAYYADQVTIEANPALRPERIGTLEFNWDQFLGDHLKTTLTAFHTYLYNLLEQVTDPSNGLSVFENQAGIVSTGMDGRAEGKWENGTTFRLGYTFQNAHYATGGSLLDNSPRTLLKGAVTVPLPWRKGFATLQGNYVGPRLNLFQEWLGGATAVNLTLLQRDLWPGLDLAVSAYNLLDVRVSDSPGPGQVNSLGEALHAIPQDGLTWRVQVTRRF